MSGVTGVTEVTVRAQSDFETVEISAQVGVLTPDSQGTSAIYQVSASAANTTPSATFEVEVA